jgi:clan AA aspartic protease (TIGR02281 family)
MRQGLLAVILLIVFGLPAYAQMYKWLDEKGTVHFTDDVLKIPEKYRSNAESRKTPKEAPAPQRAEKPPSISVPQKPSELAGFEIPLKVRGAVAVTEVILNGREKSDCIVDTGASFTNISWTNAKNLGITIDDDTPFIPVTTASNVILSPLVVLKSVSVGKAEVKDVDVLINDLPGSVGGLLGNSFLHRFKVVLEPLNGKMTLFQLQGGPSPDRPGGYGREYWENRFRFCHANLERLNGIKSWYQKRDLSSEVLALSRVKKAIQYFENQLGEWDRKASIAGVPRHWRE